MTKAGLMTVKRFLTLVFVAVQRMDLGECVKIHDLALRADYEIASKQQEYFFELDVSMNSLRSCASDCMCL